MKILKEGTKPTRIDKNQQKEYIKKCWNCKCEYIYHQTEIECICLGEDFVNTIVCPYCNYRNNIFIKRRYRGNNE